MTEARLVQTEEEAKQAPDFNQRAYNWIERHPLVTLVALVIACVGVVLFLVIVYWAFRPESAPEGAGFVYTVPIPGQELYRTGWDWLGLLIVPLVIAAGATIIGYVQKRTELDIAKKARKTEQQIATDRQMQTTLEAYYDRMTELMLEHGLRESPQDSEVRSIARAWTVAVVKSLDAERNRQLFSFLKASRLIEGYVPIIDLRNSDFNSVDLMGVDLHSTRLDRVNFISACLFGANLSQADLTGAYLTNANLRHANLQYTMLMEAYLSFADLRDSNLSGAVLPVAHLDMALLSKANLSHSLLHSADLSNSLLRESNLEGAQLDYVNLKGTSLAMANLSGANLNGAKSWTIKQFDEAYTLEAATMPDGAKLKGKNNDGPTYDEWKAQHMAKHGEQGSVPG